VRDWVAVERGLAVAAMDSAVAARAVASAVWAAEELETASLAVEGTVAEERAVAEVVAAALVAVARAAAAMG
tara:strand:+ start:1032 stop:1247 length:216 start_codon:yes stop_codon:yes gene_type:complete